MRSKGQVLGLIIILGLLFLSTLSCTTFVEASPITTVTLKLQDDPPTVDVSPGSNGIVEINGEVTCEKYGPDDVRVFLTSSTELGSASTEPSSFVFSGVSGTVQTLPFIVTTRIPQGTSSSLTPSLTVQGYFDQGGLRNTIPPVSQIIIILQYYKIGYFIEDKEVPVKSGESAKIEFIVSNLGNGEDTFQIDFENREHLQTKGFQLKEPFEVNMEENTNKSVKVHVRAPEGTSGRHLADISLVSKGSLESDSMEKVIMSIRLEVTSDLGGDIGSFITSPLGILIIVVVIVVAVILKKKKKEKVPSNSD